MTHGKKVPTILAQVRPSNNQQPAISIQVEDKIIEESSSLNRDTIQTGGKKLNKPSDAENATTHKIGQGYQWLKEKTEGATLEETTVLRMS